MMEVPHFLFDVRNGRYYLISKEVEVELQLLYDLTLNQEIFFAEIFKAFQSKSDHKVLYVCVEGFDRWVEVEIAPGFLYIRKWLDRDVFVTYRLAAATMRDLWADLLWCMDLDQHTSHLTVLKYRVVAV